MKKDNISEPRKFAIAKRCQLIIGSFDGSVHNCPCEASGDCKLTDQEIEQFSKNPEIIEAIKRNKEIYDNSKDLNED